MRPRLDSVITVLLALLVLVDGSRSVVCDLACGLGSRVVCHGETPASALPASTDDAMAGMHCSGMESVRASKLVAASVQFESGEMGPCRHSSPLATMSPDPASERSPAIHWVVVDAVLTQLAIASDRSIANANAPPLLPAAHPHLVTLRV